MQSRRLTLPMIAAVVALAVPACSTTNAPAPSSTTTTTATTTSAAPQAHGVYEQCLTEHGVPSPPAGPPPGPEPQPQGPPPGPPPNAEPGTAPSATIPPPPPGVDETTWANAQKACASLQPAPPTPTS